MRYYAVLGHGLAVQAIRAQRRRDTKAGFADNAEVAVPIADTPKQVNAAEIAYVLSNQTLVELMCQV